MMSFKKISWKNGGIGMDNNSCIFVVFVCKLCVVLSENHVVLLYVGRVVFGVKYCCQQCIVFGWYNLFVNFYILFDLVGCILVCVCCLRRARALQNGASGGGAILPRQRALQNGAPGGGEIDPARGNGIARAAFCF
jgi:hypothetical protein